MDRRQFGYRGEASAAHFLQAKGMRVIESNFTVRGGEIDLIAENGDRLVFVEVKSRSENQSFGTGIESINRHKFHLIRRTINCYMFKYNQDVASQIDVVEIIFKNSGMVKEVEHLSDVTL